MELSTTLLKPATCTTRTQTCSTSSPFPAESQQTQTLHLPHSDLLQDRQNGAGAQGRKNTPGMGSILPTPPSCHEEQLWSCFGGHLPYHSACPPCMRVSSRAHSAGCTSGCSLPPRCRGAGCRSRGARRVGWSRAGSLSRTEVTSTGCPQRSRQPRWRRQQKPQGRAFLPQEPDKSVGCRFSPAKPSVSNVFPTRPASHHLPLPNGAGKGGNMNQVMTGRGRGFQSGSCFFLKGEHVRKTPDLIQSVVNWFKTSNNTKFTG